MTPEDMARTHAAAFTNARPWSAQEFAELAQDRFTSFAGDAACFAVIRTIADEAELLTIATHPNHQRQGLARKLMQTWMQRAAEAGARSALLEVAADNAPALRLYSDLGFAENGRRKGYYRRAGHPSQDAILMARALP
jgi:ribosomal-protein-alanine N-acetyltransferase